MERIGRYEIIAELGRGAMGVVYRARDTKIGREVAIKTIRLSDKVDPSEVSALRERLFREAQSAGRLSHPGIVTIYDIAEEGDLAYISMELVEGRNLESMIASREARDFGFLARVMRYSAAALDYAHSRDIIHRDVKPANLMITDSDRVKITDFGIARISSSQLTQTGTVMGTPSYMSPEQVKGDPLDGRSDQFSLAVIAYEMMTGQKPFAGENLTSVMFKIVSETPVEPKTHNPAIPPPVQNALLRALSKNPRDRYPACAAFAAALASQIEAQGISIALGDGEFDESEESTETSVDFGATAPMLGALKVEEESDKTRPAIATPALKPLSSSRARGGEMQMPPSLPLDAKGDKLPRLPSGGPVEREDEVAGRRWGRIVALVVLLALSGGIGYVAFTNPWMLQDPIGTVRNLFGSGQSDHMNDSVALLLDKDRSPLPPRELTEPIEQGVEKRGAAKTPAAQTAEPAAETPAADQPTTDQPSGETPAATTASGERSEPATAETKAETKTETAELKKAAPPVQPRAPRTFAIHLKSSTAGAQVVVDRNPQWSCASPCSLQLPVGRHVAVASLSGYRSYPKIFEAGPDTADVEIQMRAITGTLLISSEPTGAEVYVDGRRTAGVTNLQLDAGPGYHVILVKKEGAGSAERSISVQEGGLQPVHFVLGAAGVERGKLVVRSVPSGADIVVNDRQRVGTTPAEVDLAPGRYRVAISRSGYRPVIRDIELTPGQPQNMDVTLSPQN